MCCMSGEKQNDPKKEFFATTGSAYFCIVFPPLSPAQKIQIQNYQKYSHGIEV